MDRTIESDDWKRYENACEIGEMLDKQWRELGKPLLFTHPNGTHGAHPLLKLILEVETHAHRLARALSKRGRAGRPTEAVRGPDETPEHPGITAIKASLPKLKLAKARENGAA
jgi:hypothetical protein